MTQEIPIPMTEKVKLSDLQFDGKNPNVLNKEGMERLKASIKKWGDIVPIVTNKDLLVADGQQRSTAMKELGMTECSVIRLPVEEVDRRLLRQVLNKLRGEHELLLDAEEFESIIKLGKKDDLKYLLDLTDGKLERYLNELHPPKDEDFEVPEIDKVQTDIVKGDIIQLGKHRLMCGDATIPAEMDLLLNGAIPRMIFTDPPYGVSFDKHTMKDDCFKRDPQGNKSGSGFRNWGKIKGDDSIDTFLKFIEVISKTKLVDGSWYMCTSSKFIGQVLGKLEEQEVYYATPIIWVKENFVLSWERYKAQHENIIFAGQGAHPTGGKSIWYGKNNESTVWQINRDNMNKEAKHPTQKPVALVARALFNSSQPEDSIYDAFGGSGTTLMACEQHGRVCYMMELSEKFCEVICQRWESYTQKKRVNLVKTCENHVQ